MSRALSPIRLGRLALRNRVVKAATYEGMMAGGAPSESLLRHHVELAKGGVGMTTVAYASVSKDGRTFSEQMVMSRELLAPLRTLTDAVHREGAAAMLQLGHSGGFSKNEELGMRGPLGPSVSFNAYGAFKGMPLSRAMTPSDLKQTRDDFVHAALAAFEAGFDAVELHLGHGYLLSQFLSPHRNHRSDEYGGSLQNRMRFPLEIVRAVRNAVGPEAPLFIKTNLDDGVQGGLTVQECILVCKALEQEGVSAIVLSGGLVSHSALFLLRGERPLAQMVEVETNRFQKAAIKLFGPFLVKAIPFSPLFFLPLASQVRAEVKVPLVYLGGATSLSHLDTAIEAGFELVAMGRALIREPDLLNRFASGQASEGTCTPCNACITEMDRPGGVACAQEGWQLERRAAEVAAGKHLRVIH